MVALFAIHFSSTSTVGAKKKTAPSAASTASAGGGGWLTSGTLGVSMDDDEEQPGETAAAPRSKKTKKKGKKGGGSKKKKGAPAETSAAPGGWLAAAVSTGTFGTPQDGEDQDQSDSDDSTSDLEPPKSPTKKSGSAVRKQSSSPGRGMPSWAPAKPAIGDDTAPASDVEKTQRKGLGGGRPPWAPALPEPIAAPAKEESSTAEEPTPKADEDISSEGDLPDWLAAAAGGGTKPKVSVAACRRATKICNRENLMRTTDTNRELWILEAQQPYACAAAAMFVWPTVEIHNSQ